MSAVNRLDQKVDLADKFCALLLQMLQKTLWYVIGHDPGVMAQPCNLDFCLAMPCLPAFWRCILEQFVAECFLC